MRTGQVSSLKLRAKGFPRLQKPVGQNVSKRFVYFVLTRPQEKLKNKQNSSWEGAWRIHSFVFIKDTENSNSQHYWKYYMKIIILENPYLIHDGLTGFVDWSSETYLLKNIATIPLSGCRRFTCLIQALMVVSVCQREWLLIKFWLRNQCHFV